jgi:hypothetical protein
MVGIKRWLRNKLKESDGEPLGATAAGEVVVQSQQEVVRSADATFAVEIGRFWLGSKEDPPRFGRNYTVRIADGAKVSIDMHNCSVYRERRVASALAIQADGRRIAFEPSAIADKSLDPRVVPLIAAACRAIRHADDVYMASDETKQFTDNMGVTWRRVA